MKFIAFFTFILLLVNFSSQIPKFEDCEPDKLPESLTGCMSVKCTGDSSSYSYSGVGCSEYRCQSGEQIGYKEEDNTKVYPDCCGGPICRE